MLLLPSLGFRRPPPAAGAAEAAAAALQPSSWTSHSCSSHWQVEKPSDITAADKLIFPGVGSFGQAIEVLQKKDYTKPLVDYIQVGLLVRL